MVVLGNGGVIYERDDEDRWEQVPTPSGTNLLDLALGSPDVAVGKGGTIIERPRGRPRDAGTSPDGDQYDGRGEYYDGDGTAAGSDGTDGSTSTSDGTTSDGSTDGSSTETTTDTSSGA
jgi:hypothetical protein